MQKIAFILVAICLIGLGSYRQFGSQSVSVADRTRCEAIVKEAYAASPQSSAMLIEKCGEPGMVAMMDARKNNLGAEAAAQSIASANHQDILSILLNCALIGAGIGAAGAAVGAGRKKA